MHDKVNVLIAGSRRISRCGLWTVSPMTGRSTIAEHAMLITLWSYVNSPNSRR